MERRKRPYSFQRRPGTIHRHFYYVKFRDDTGAYGSAISTGCTRKDDAVRWCESELQRRKEQRENITLGQYADGFWKKDAPFGTDRAAHDRAVSNGFWTLQKATASPFGEEKDCGI